MNARSSIPSASSFACVRCHTLLSPDAGEHCKQCDGPLFDLTDDIDREAVRDAVLSEPWAEPDRTRVYIAAIAASFVALLLEARFCDDHASSIPRSLFILGLVGMLVMHLARSFETPAQVALREGIDNGILERDHRRDAREKERAAALRARLWTGAPVFAAAFVLMLHASHARMGLQGVLDAFAMFPASIQRGERLHSLLTAGFVHASWFHVIGNTLALIGFGRRLDLRIGRMRTALVLLAGIVGGNVAQAWLGNASLPCVGISGGCYALIGAMMTVMPQHRACFVIQGTRVVVPVRVWSLLTLGVYGVLGMLIYPHVAFIAHAAGFVAGMLVGLAYRGVEQPADSAFFERRFERRLSHLEQSRA